MASPLRWFRRHQKGMLVVFGVGLMAAFGLGSVLTSFGGNSGGGPAENPVIAKWKDGEFRRMDLNRMAELHFQCVRFLNSVQATAEKRKPENFRPLAFPISAVVQPGQQASQEYIDENMITKYLLADKARTEGIIIGDGFIDDYISMVAGNVEFSKNDLTQIHQEANQVSGGMQLLREHLKMELAAQQMYAFRNAGFPGVPNFSESVAMYDRTSNRIECQVIGVPVNASDISETPSAGEKKELFEEGKYDFMDPRGLAPGFKINKTVKVQYMLADRESFISNAMNAVTDQQVEEEYARLVEEKSPMVMEVIPDTNMPEIPGMPGLPEEPSTPDDQAGSEDAPDIFSSSDPADDDAPAPPPGDELVPDELVPDDGGGDEMPEPTAGETSDDTPADDTPADETPADETPANETPADEPPDAETSDDETPAETDPDDDGNDDNTEDDGAADEDGQASLTVSLRGTYVSTRMQDETETPETETPETEPQETETPETDSPETEATEPETDQAADQVPGETASPETETPETATQTETDEPGDQEPAGTTIPVDPTAGNADAPAGQFDDMVQVPEDVQLPGFADEPELAKRTKTLAECADDIRRSLAEVDADRALEAAMDQAEAQLGQYRFQHLKWRAKDEKERGPKPEMDFVSLAKEHQLTFAETELVDEVDIDSTPVGQFEIFRVVNTERGPQPRIVSLGTTIFDRFESASEYEAGRESDFRTRNGMLYWLSEKESTKVPTLEEADAAITEYWRRQKAYDQAVAEANRLAAAVGAGQQLATVYPERAIPTGEFTWFNSASGTPQISTPVGVISPDDVFMETAFGLSVNEVGVAPNRFRDTVYVVQLVSPGATMAETGQDYLENRLFKFNRIPTDVIQVSQWYGRESQLDWNEEFVKEMGLEFISQ